jgi:hypothetical protein
MKERSEATVTLLDKLAAEQEAQEESAVKLQIITMASKDRPWSPSSGSLRPRGMKVGDIATVRNSFAEETVLIRKVFQGHQRTEINGDGRHYTVQPAAVDSAGAICVTSKRCKTGVKGCNLKLLFTAAQCAEQDACTIALKAALAAHSFAHTARASAAGAEQSRVADEAAAAAAGVAAMIAVTAVDFARRLVAYVADVVGEKVACAEAARLKVLAEQDAKEAHATQVALKVRDDGEKDAAAKVLQAACDTFQGRMWMQQSLRTQQRAEEERRFAETVALELAEDAGSRALVEHLNTEAGKLELLETKTLLKLKHLVEKKARSNLTRDEQKRAQVRAVFEEFDVDRSGTIDVEEFQVLLHELAIPMSAEEVEQTFLKVCVFVRMRLSHTTAVSPCSHTLHVCIYRQVQITISPHMHLTHRLAL